jgi:hypothetical protein
MQEQKLGILSAITKLFHCNGLLTVKVLYFGQVCQKSDTNYSGHIRFLKCHDKGHFLGEEDLFPKLFDPPFKQLQGVYISIMEKVHKLELKQVSLQVDHSTSLC